MTIFCRKRLQDHFTFALLRSFYQGEPLFPTYEQKGSESYKNDEKNLRATILGDTTRIVNLAILGENDFIEKRTCLSFPEILREKNQPTFIRLKRDKFRF